MSSLSRHYKTDKKLEQEGTIVDYGDYKLVIARAGGANKGFTSALEVVMKPHRRGIQSGNVSNELLVSIQKPVYAKHILLDWSGVTDDDTGEEIQCTPEAVLNEFEDNDFFLEVQEMSNSLANFKAQNDEEDSKN